MHPFQEHMHICYLHSQIYNKALPNHRKVARIFVHLEQLFMRYEAASLFTITAYHIFSEGYFSSFVCCKTLLCRAKCPKALRLQQ